MEKLVTLPRSRINLGTLAETIFIFEQIEQGIDLKRIGWLKKLKLVQRFIFFADRRMDNMATYKGEWMTTNQWIYKAVREVLPTNRIVDWECFQSRLGNLESSTLN